jgi:hypothetical protein
MFKKTFFALTLFASPFFVFAASIHIGADYFLKGSEETGEDVYVFAPSAIFAGSVSGDR